MTTEYEGASSEELFGDDGSGDDGFGVAGQSEEAPSVADATGDADGAPVKKTAKAKAITAALTRELPDVAAFIERNVADDAE